jgi:hypothetical protein
MLIVIDDQGRFSNPPGEEIKVAAAEQQKIAELRLRNLKAWEGNAISKQPPGSYIIFLLNVVRYTSSSSCQNLFRIIMAQA